MLQLSPEDLAATCFAVQHEGVPEPAVALSSKTPRPRRRMRSSARRFLNKSLLGPGAPKHARSDVECRETKSLHSPLDLLTQGQGEVGEQQRVRGRCAA
eukprot:1026813-Pyramimonas_sp.AAC.1